MNLYTVLYYSFQFLGLECTTYVVLMFYAFHCHKKVYILK